MEEFIQSAHKGKTPIAVKANLEKVTMGSIVYVHLLVRPFLLVICAVSDHSYLCRCVLPSPRRAHGTNWTARTGTVQRSPALFSTLPSSPPSGRKIWRTGGLGEY